jgi:hypothetical protein
MQARIRYLILATGIFLALGAVGSSCAQESDFCKKLVACKLYIKLSPTLARSLLIQTSDPVIPHHPMAARVTGTVVALFELGTHGEVLCPIVWPESASEASFGRRSQIQIQTLPFQWPPCYC